MLWHRQLHIKLLPAPGQFKDNRGSSAKKSPAGYHIPRVPDLLAVAFAAQVSSVSSHQVALVCSSPVGSDVMGPHCSERPVVKRLTAPFQGGRSWKASRTFLLPVVVRASPGLHSGASAIPVCQLTIPMWTAAKTKQDSTQPLQWAGHGGGKAEQKRMHRAGKRRGAQDISA